MTPPRTRIGIDVGGTFTDFVLVDPAAGTMRLFKEPSVPQDPSAAVERGLATLLAETGTTGADVELVVHGTTIGLNAIIQRRGARMALVVSTGNRDILEIARLRLPSSYDFTAPRERPLVPRDRVFEIEARMRSDGTIVAEPDEDALAALAEAIREADVEAVSVMFLNSYRDASLERRVADALRARLPHVLVSESGVIWPEIREYERCLVGALNAYVQPMMTRYFDRLEAGLARIGVGAPVYITANNGGTLALETARARPIDTVLSGPASGVVASAAVGAGAARRRLVTFDMGGTSADIAVCRAGEPEFTQATFVGDFPLMMPVVNVGAIGAGGGSIVWVDAQGLLKVGPLSAGADPGPACYGRGGHEPTVTDCYLALGIIAPDRFLGGRMRLDVDAAEAALTALAPALGIDGADAPARVAEAALRVASARMGTEIGKLLAREGVDPRDFALVAYGGAGPTHACLLAESAGLDAVLVPMTPGAFCALGAVLADVRRDYVRTARHVLAEGLSADEWPAVAAILAELEEEARAFIAREGDLVGAHDLVVSVQLRYPGQAYEIEVAVPEAARRTLGSASLADLFHAEHARLYGFSEPGSPVVTSTIRLGVIGRMAAIRLPEVPARATPEGGTRPVFRDGVWREARVHARADLGEGALVEGPAIVEQADTTTFVLPGWRARADRLGTLHLVRSTGA